MPLFIKKSEQKKDKPKEAPQQDSVLDRSIALHVENLKRRSMYGMSTIQYPSRKELDPILDRSITQQRAALLRSLNPKEIVRDRAQDTD